MSAQILAFRAAGAPAVARLCKGVIVATAITLIAPALILGGCTDVPPAPVAGADPSDPGARAPRVDYRSSIGAYKSQRPVSPGPSDENKWREQNEQVTPAPKSGQ
jgi:hypothetical protein